MSLTLSLRFPTGRFAAAAWDDRGRAEWPPHPARLALAFTDVLHKAGNPNELREALLWLCRQGAPEIVVPAADHIDIQRMDGFYVPQNPSVAEGAKPPRKPRAFPTVHLDSEQATVFFHWPSADPNEPILLGLRELASRLPRLGHSSSLAIATVSRDTPPSQEGWQSLEPASDPHQATGIRIRVPYAGLLESAEAEYAAEDRARERDDLVRKAAKGLLWAQANGFERLLDQAPLLRA